MNDREAVRLQIWLDKNRNLAFEPMQAELFRLVDMRLEDKVITDHERKLTGEYVSRIEKRAVEKLRGEFERKGK